MDDIIHLLPDSVANKIAAGEVVQRPSSIIKEMMENSIDAGAQNIQVYVVDGGKTCVQIIDDGKGMSETDARLSFERHATSKIVDATDLFKLSTMGFRGEALASIAAVAQVELKTRRAEDELGTVINIAGSKIESQEPTACPVGSNFAVKNLFYNIPARRKFLKSSQTEMANVVSDFERIVLVYPNISFTLYNNGTEAMNLPKASVRQRIVDVFGRKLNGELLPIETDTSIVGVSGYVAKPDASKKKGTHRYFFVNGRYMNHKYFHSAVMRAYDNLIPAGEQISYFIYLSVDPSTIDVNVHPTKTEIKFDNEQAIWQVLFATVKETIGKFSNVPLIDFDIEDRPSIPIAGSGPVFDQPKGIKATYNPFKQSSKSNTYFDDYMKVRGGINGSSHNDRLENEFDVELNLPENDGNETSDGNFIPSMGNQSIGGGYHLGKGKFGSQNNNFDVEAVGGVDINQIKTLGSISEGADLFATDAVIPSVGLNEKMGLDFSVPKFQFKGRYIVLPCREGLMMVNQKRAHVRILFERCMDSLKNGKLSSQGILFPMLVELSKAEAMILDSEIEKFISLGFELTNLGGGSFSVTGIPVGLEGADVAKILHEMVVSISEKIGDAEMEIKESLSFTLAKASAIVYGQVLTNAEMESLLKDLFNTTSPARTPDGKLIYSIVDNKTIEKIF